MSCNKCFTIKPKIYDGLDSNYCPNCGFNLKEMCKSCYGSGKRTTVPEYCSNCGSLKDNTCSSCNGQGKIKIHHSCY